MFVFVIKLNRVDNTKIAKTMMKEPTKNFWIRNFYWICKYKPTSTYSIFVSFASDKHTPPNFKEGS